MRMDRKSPAQEFAAASATYSMASAPRDGTPIVGRNLDGDCFHIRRCVGEDLEPGEHPHWARWDTDVEFHPIFWIPTEWDMGDILEAYS
jgi:hypothetical protein